MITHNRLTVSSAGILLTLSLLLGGLTLGWQQAHAQTDISNLESFDREALIQLVQQLIEKIGETTPSDSEPSVSPNSDIIVGSSIETADRLRVRSDARADGSMVGTAAPGSTGTVERGPIDRDGHKWWFVRYEDGRAGWSAGDWLRKRTTNNDENDQVNDDEVQKVDSLSDIGNRWDEQFDTPKSVSVRVAPSLGRVPLTVTVRANYVAQTGMQEINFGDSDEWVPLEPCHTRSDVCIAAGITKHTYTKVGKYDVTVRSADGEEDVVDRVWVVGNLFSEGEGSEQEKVNNPLKPNSDRCYSYNPKGKITFSAGDSINSYFTENGEQRGVIGAKFVCRGGEWEKVSSPLKPNSDRCYSYDPKGKQEFSAGDSVTSYYTEDGEEKGISDGAFVCRGGEWKADGTSQSPSGARNVKSEIFNRTRDRLKVDDAAQSPSNYFVRGAAVSIEDVVKELLRRYTQ